MYNHRTIIDFETREPFLEVRGGVTGLEADVGQLETEPAGEKPSRRAVSPLIRRDGGKPRNNALRDSRDATSWRTSPKTTVG